MNIQIKCWMLTCMCALSWTVSAGAQTIETVYYFTNLPFTASPENPVAGLTQGKDGNFYGTTRYGGTGVGGTIFKLSTNGIVSVLVNFDSNTGGDSRAGLTLGPDGYFYGTTSFSGPGSTGTVFKMATNGALSVLFSFHPAVWNGSMVTNTDGSMPEAGLTLGPDGCFYGTTSQGGMNGGGGTIFRITTNGVLTTLFSLGNPNGSSDPSAPGGEPEAGLTLGPDGSFYGTTYSGGTKSDGTVFKITTNGAFTTIVNFDNYTNGSNPAGDLVLGPDQCLYGTTVNGGKGGDGTVFKITTNGVLTTLIAFDFRTASTPKAGLILGPDGFLYGTLSAGPSPTYAGGIFRMATNGIWTALANFASTNGSSPEAPLAWGPDGKLYGTTYAGGSPNNGEGVIYRLTLPSGNPWANITTGANGAFGLQFASATGSTNRLWATTNSGLPMAQWQVLATNVATNGIVQFNDTNTSGQQMKFYRISTP